MTRTTKLSPALAIGFAAALLGGCATPYGYSQLDGRRYVQTNIDTYPLQVTAVDGKSTPLTGPVRIEPGAHQIAVQTFPDKVHRLGIERTLTLDVKPCTHYYLVAVRPTPISPDYSVKVDYEERVAGCSPP
jgi:hypothetical protein